MSIGERIQTGNQSAVGTKFFLTNFSRSTMLNNIIGMNLELFYYDNSAKMDVSLLN